MYGSALTALLEFLKLVVCGSYLETDSGVPIALSKTPLPSEPDPRHVAPLSSVERACFLSFLGICTVPSLCVPLGPFALCSVPAGSRLGAGSQGVARGRLADSRPSSLPLCFSSFLESSLG